MLQFNELRITPDNRYLIIDVSVIDADAFDSIEISKVLIDTQDTYVHNGPSTKPVFEYEVDYNYELIYTMPQDCNCNPVLDDDDKSYCFVQDNRYKKHLRLVLSCKDYSQLFNNNMLFVYITFSGSVSEECVYKLPNPWILGVIMNMFPFYRQLMRYVKTVECDCSIPKEFIDYILRFKALELSVKTGNYPEAIRLWKKFFRIKMNKPTCIGCHG